MCYRPRPCDTSNQRRYHVYAFLADCNKTVSLTLEPDRHVWVQPISGRFEAKGSTLEKGRR